jgi:hypothetical protein
VQGFGESQSGAEGEREQDERVRDVTKVGSAGLVSVPQAIQEPASPPAPG